MKGIAAQSVLPEHIYVILPDDIAEPDRILGSEEFLRAPGGIWSQDMAALECVGALEDDEDYLLFCDSRVSFGADFAERLLETAVSCDADILLPSKTERKVGRRSGFSTRGLRTFRMRIKWSGRAVYVSDAGAGVSDTQSGEMDCFLIRGSVVGKLGLRDEMWMSSCFDVESAERVFFFKACYLGFSVKCSRLVSYAMDDGTPSGKPQERDIEKWSRNSYIFWRRFLYEPETNPIVKSARFGSFHWRSMLTSARLMVSGVGRGNLRLFRAYRNGLTRGIEFFN